MKKNILLVIAFCLLTLMYANDGRHTEIIELLEEAGATE